MIAALRGSLMARIGGHVVIDVGGVGYQVGVSTTTLSSLGDIGDPVLLHTHMVVREDAHLLYGFMTPSEKDVFLILTSVQGVGPKAALSLLGIMSIGALSRAIASGNARLLSTADGVGPKLAGRLCSELAGKLAAHMEDDAVRIPSAAGPSSSDEDDARSALENLGYSRPEAMRLVAAAMARPTPPVGVPAIVSTAMRMAAA